MHLIRPAHGSTLRGQDCAARVTEAPAGAEDRLLTDDAGPLDLLDVTYPIGDDPVTRAELNHFVAVVRDRDRIGKHEAPAHRYGFLLDVSAFHFDEDSLRL